MVLREQEMGRAAAHDDDISDDGDDAGAFAGEAEAVKQAERVAARVAAAATAGRGCGMHISAPAACCPRSEMSAWLSAGCISSRRLLHVLTSRLQDNEGTHVPSHMCIGCLFLRRQSACQHQDHLHNPPPPPPPPPRGHASLLSAQRDVSLVVCRLHLLTSPASRPDLQALG